MSADSIEVEWSEVIVLFNSLTRSVEYLRSSIESDVDVDDEQHDLEEELNDYVVLLARLRQRYEGISDKGELPQPLTKKLREICQKLHYLEKCNKIIKLLHRFSYRVATDFWGYFVPLKSALPTFTATTPIAID